MVLHDDERTATWNRSGQVMSVFSGEQVFNLNYNYYFYNIHIGKYLSIQYYVVKLFHGTPIYLL